MTYIERHISTKIIRGQAVFQLIESKSFEEKWNHLYIVTEGFAILQTKYFVKAYYDLYHPIFEPVVCIASQGKKLIGLLFLAWHKTENYLVHAGRNEAEYHGWLAISGFEINFLKQSFHLLRQQFPITRWEWEWLPPNFNKHTIQAALDEKMSITYEIQEAPICNLSSIEKLQKLKKRKSVKYQIKQLQKRGELIFEVIENIEKLKQVLITVKRHFDFRQQAIYGIAPFKDDPYKEELMIRLFQAGIGHASVLWLDNQVLGFAFCCKDDKRIYLNTISYNPLEARFSPGTLILLELAESLKKDGYEYFDLTPGERGYKDRFANEYQTLYKPTIIFKPTIEWQEKLKRLKNIGINWIKIGIEKAGIKMATLRTIRDNLQGFPEKIDIKVKHNSIWDLLRKAIYKQQQIQVYLVSKKNNLPPIANYFQTQRFEHLMAYEDHRPFLKNRPLYQDALKKLSNGAILYTRHESGQLKAYAWRLSSKKPLFLQGCPKSIKLEEGIAVGDFYQNSRDTSQQSFVDFVEQVLIANATNIDQNTYILLRQQQQLPSNFKEKWGLVLKEKYTWHRIFYYWLNEE